ncbi:CYFA0S01e11782g1_1 [Cyberlindnera fabianii]|uniref:phosphopentomutase n=1 Tax=Cyberlindnera fabianii TaxID=36022 RepID=A0A061AQC6_CYBFA|nr:CYFA0S01e11782g1_1 [Cyberlindnera fabianii]
MVAPSIDVLVNQWLSIDVNHSTIQEIKDLHASNNVSELELRLRNRIAFGTAGLRATMEAGFSRMNDVTVLQASQGLASYVRKQNSTADELSIVIGHDHRHHSKEFAQITATAFLLKGFKVYLLESESGDLVPTPMVPFAVDTYKASCGVMITASHNPAQDNGYKVYWSNGCQIIPPHDYGIASEIEKNLVPVDRAHDVDAVLEESLKSGDLILAKQKTMEAYLEHLQKTVVKSSVEGLRFVYTPMHGVGQEIFEKVVKMIGVRDRDLVRVKEQMIPDPDFPSVKFPNPEEKGALDLAIETADSEGIDIVVANDPDADRFSAAVKTNGKWRQLTGNEIGFLFADYTIKTTDIPREKMYLLNSTVSSQMIASMANKEGFSYADTLTGFKWIGNKAIDLEKEGKIVPFAYEEAIGFMFEGIHDKDGISAATVFLQMAQKWKEAGKNAIEVLEDGFKRYGYFKEYNSYYIVPYQEATKEIFDSVIRASSGSKGYPETIGSYSVIYWRDLTTGFESATADGKPLLPVDSSAQMITAKLDTGVPDEEIRFTARGSGTEPKLKVYIEAKAATEERSAELAADVWGTLRDAWFQPSVTGLKEA